MSFRLTKHVDELVLVDEVDKIELVLSMGQLSEFRRILANYSKKERQI